MISERHHISPHSLSCGGPLSGRKSWALFLGILFFLPIEASAGAPGEKWDINLGMGVATQPKYEGSRDIEAIPVPVVEMTWNDRLFVSSTRTEAGGYLLNDGPFRLGLAMGYRAGRKEKISARLRGMGDIQGAATGRLFVDYAVGSLHLSGDVRRAMGGSDGVRLDAGLSRSIRLSETTSVNVGAAATWADKNEMQTYFGVTALQSKRSGLASFSPGAGLKSVKARLDMTWNLTRHWNVDATGIITRLVGDAGHGPLVEKTIQPLAMVSLNYTF